jgi:DNA-binding GntR family transcriptional regulator
MVRDQGRVPSTELLSARLQPASAAICARLRLPALSSVVRICRLRRIDGRAVLYAEHYLNPSTSQGFSNRTWRSR